MTKESIHISVMKNEALDHLKVNDGGVFLDCTLGGAGHSKAILEANDKNIVYACDRDEVAVERAKPLEEEYKDRFFVEKGNFSDVANLFEHCQFDGILADLGLSSDQLDGMRGFSVKDEESLDMRMGEDGSISAHHVVNEFSLNELRSMFRRGGVRTQVNSMANAIIRNRPIEDSKTLANIINSAVRTDGKKKSPPAIVAFQAIRIEVNDELNEIKNLLVSLPQVAKSGCRLVVISFHSLEDKLVTSQLRKWDKGDTKPALWNEQNEEKEIGDLITKEAIFPTEIEVGENSRSRSARLRSFIFH